MSTAVADRIRALANTDIDWSYLFDLAARHTVVTLVWRTLESVVPEAVPSTLADRARERRDASVMHSYFLANELAAVAQLLDGAGVRSLSFKGPMLAMSVYGDLALREFYDLDLLVHPDTFERASAVLETNGYALAADHGWQATFVRGAVGIDLHRAITQPAYAVPLDFDRWWVRHQMIDIAGTAVPAIGTEDLLLLLAVQVARDTWGWTLHLRKLCDIVETATLSRGLDWLGVEMEARRLRVRWILAFGLQFAARLLGTGLPEAAARVSAGSRSVRALAAAECEGFLEEPSPHARAMMRGVAFHARIRERMRDRLRPIWLNRHGLVIPNANDRAVVSLPEWLSLLYYAIRPLRLFWKYGGWGLMTRDPSPPPRTSRADTGNCTPEQSS